MDVGCFPNDFEQPRNRCRSQRWMPTVASSKVAGMTLKPSALWLRFARRFQARRFLRPNKNLPSKKTPRLCADLFQQRATAMARISGSYQGREVACWWSKNVAWEEDGRTACWGRICCEYSKRPKRLGWCFANCINFAFRVKLEDCRLVAMINWLFQKTPLPVNTHGSVWGMLPDNVTLGIPGITRSWGASKPPLWRPCAKVI